MILNETLVSASGRTLLVPPSEGDDVLMAALRCHPETRRYISLIPPEYTTDDARARRTTRAADNAIVDFTIYAVAECARKFVGGTSMFKIDEVSKSCEVGIQISPDIYRGGFATEALQRLLVYAFEERGLHRVVMQTGAHNVRMRAWLERAGAVLEGTLRDGRADGEGGYTDVCVYSILEQDWVQSVKAKLEKQVKRTVAV